MEGTSRRSFLKVVGTAAAAFPGTGIRPLRGLRSPLTWCVTAGISGK